MKTNLLFITLYLAFFSLTSFSQNTGHADLDINNVRARFNACGNNFWDLDSLGEHFEVPKNTGKTSIFNQALWIGGLDINGQLKLAAERYRSNGEDFWPGPVSNVYDSVYDAQWNKVWKLNKAAIDSFKLWYNNPSAYPTYLIPSEILNWPAHGNVSNGQAFNLAPFHDHNQDGIYNPNNGDYPLIKGDQAIFYIYNDARNIHTETGGAKLNVEIHVMAYAFNCNGPLGNTIFVNYKIYNRSTFNLSNTLIGVYADLDLGDSYDDLMGCDVIRGAFYGSDVDTIGPGQPPPNWTPPPSQAVVVLGGPYMDSDGIDNPKIDSLGNPMCDNSINGLNFGDGIIDNERFGLTKTLFYNNSSSASFSSLYDPVNASEYYGYLQGIVDSNNNRLSYGGSGIINGTPPAYGPACNYMFPGGSDPCNWGTGGIIPNGMTDWFDPFNSTVNLMDRRGLGVTGPFTFGAGQMHELDLAYVWAQATSGGSFASVELMRLDIDTIRGCFLKDSFPCNGPFTHVPYKTWEEDIIQEFILYPNPSNDKIAIKQSDIIYKEYEIYDILGKSVLSGRLEKLTNIDIKLLPNGLYFFKAYNKNKVHTKKFIKN